MHRLLGMASQAVKTCLGCRLLWKELLSGVCSQTTSRWPPFVPKLTRISFLESLLWRGMCFIPCYLPKFNSHTTYVLADMTIPCPPLLISYKWILFIESSFHCLGLHHLNQFIWNITFYLCILTTFISTVIVHLHIYLNFMVCCFTLAVCCNIERLSW